jgi:hypothetical protein
VYKSSFGERARAAFWHCDTLLTLKLFGLRGLQFSSIYLLNTRLLPQMVVIAHGGAAARGNAIGIAAVAPMSD